MEVDTTLQSWLTGGCGIRLEKTSGPPRPETGSSVRVGTEKVDLVRDVT